ncbi:hypothetical protein BH09PSE2_BH09PSE2_02150 [soil metagenome]
MVAAPHTLARTLAVRTFRMADQEAFAAASGDRNPMHMDPLAARRTQMGRPVVHGMHALLWALDALAAATDAHPLGALRCQFLKPMYLDEPLETVLVASTPTEAKLEVRAAGAAVLKATLKPAAPSTVEPEPLPAAVPADAAWDVLDIAQMQGLSGAVSPLLPGAAPLFPALVQAIGAERVRGLTVLSTIVGMRCPGLHSIFAGLKLSLAEPTGTSAVGWRAQHVDARFRSVTLTVWGPGLAGELEALVRRPPTEQSDAAAVSALVDGDEFVGVRALVVGGSRGLGALCARILAAGGAEVVLTYARGEADAQAVAADIVAAGGRAQVAALDVERAVAPQLADLAFAPSHLFHFATGPIFSRRDGLFDSPAFASFARFYVEGFAETVDACRANGDGKLRAFYPSSTAVADRPRGMTEYAMAKAAGELLCEDLDRWADGVSVVIRRLPRLLTDQTAVTAPVAVGDSLAVMLEAVRATCAAA